MDILNTICPLESIGRPDTPTVGAKAAALGELLRAGFDVPSGFVLTTGACVQMMARLRERIDARLTADVIEDPAEIETAAEQVRAWIEAEPWPELLHAEIGAALQVITSNGEGQSFAARTSLPTREMATAFGAGVERASLGLVGIDQIERGAARCWGALWNSRAMYYRHRKKIPQAQVSLAVLIQPMIHAEAAGVMLTQNPQTGADEEMQIDSIWGLGAPLMQARVKPDRFIFAKAEQAILERQTEGKPVRLVVAADGSLEQQAVEGDLMDAPSLTDAQVISLAHLGQRIEEFFREPQDIEWARIGDRFYILQSQPIAMRRG